MKRTACGALLTVLLGGMAASAAHAGAGENGFAFLKVAAGTEAVGMGEAYTSHVSDATALYWNPAGLARVTGTDLLVMHNEFISDIRLEYIGVARTFGRHGVGISFNGLFTSDLEGRDAEGNLTGEVGYHDISLSVGYAFRAVEDGFLADDLLTLGAGAKYLREFIGNPAATDDHVATGAAFDLGAQYQAGPVEIGAALRNLGSKMSFNTVQTVSSFSTGFEVGGTEFDLPAIVQAGVTFTPPLTLWEGGLSFAVEGRKVRGEDFNVLVGTRYHYRNLAALSVGYSSGLDTQDIAFGAQVFKDAFRVGYAFVPYSDDLGTSHRFSLGYRVP